MPEQNIETGWLIEKCELAEDGPEYLFVENHPEYLIVESWFGFSFTTDSLKAIRFARRTDAEQVLLLLETEDCKATEHQWG